MSLKSRLLGTRAFIDFESETLGGIRSYQLSAENCQNIGEFDNSNPFASPEDFARLVVQETSIPKIEESSSDLVSYKLSENQIKDLTGHDLTVFAKSYSNKFFKDIEILNDLHTEHTHREENQSILEDFRRHTLNEIEVQKKQIRDHTTKLSDAFNRQTEAFRKLMRDRTSALSATEQKLLDQNNRISSSLGDLIIESRRPSPNINQMGVMNAYSIDANVQLKSLIEETSKSVELIKSLNDISVEMAMESRSQNLHMQKSNRNALWMAVLAILVAAASSFFTYIKSDALLKGFIEMSNREIGKLEALTSITRDSNDLSNHEIGKLEALTSVARGAYDLDVQSKKQRASEIMLIKSVLDRNARLESRIKNLEGQILSLREIKNEQEQF